MAKAKGKTITTDDLAVMVQKGFTDMQNRFTEERRRTDDMFKLVFDRFEKVEADIGDIKRTLGPLVQMMALTDKKVDNLELRLRQVERKVGIGR